MKTTEKIFLSVAALGILGAAAYVIYKVATTKSAAQKEKEAREFRKKNPYKPLSESQLDNISKSFSKKIIEQRLQNFGKPISPPTPFSQSGGFTSPSLIDKKEYSIFQPFNPSNQPSGTLNFTPRYLNAIGQFGIAGI